jgi:hypothetical protein
LALLEAGDPAEAIDQSVSWLARTAALPAGPSAHDPPIPSLAEERGVGAGGELRSRLVSAMRDLGFRHGRAGMKDLAISWGDGTSALRLLIDRLRTVAARLPEGASQQRQRAVDSIEFLEISAAWDPAIDSTTDRIAARVLPQVKRFLARNSKTDDPDARAMHAWLRTRFARYLVVSPEGD